MRVHLCITGLAMLLMMVSCHKDTNDVVLDSGAGFFPVQEGHWVQYRVDSAAVYGMQTDSSHWDVREVVGARTFGETRLLCRWFRRAGSSQWTEHALVWMISSNPSEALKTESNVCYVKLVFPLSEGRKWDGNMYNGLESQEYSMTGINQGLTLGNLSFPETVSVLQSDLTTLISRDYSMEVYARDVGMISARKIHMENLQSVEHKYGYSVDVRVTGWGEQ